MRRLALLAAGLVMCGALSLQAGALTSQVDGIRVELMSRPGRPVANGQTEYVVRLVDESGRPVRGARLTLRGIMPDGMSIVAPLRPAGEPGRYQGRVLFTMEGRWALTLRIAHEGKRFELPLAEQVGR